MSLTQHLQMSEGKLIIETREMGSVELTEPGILIDGSDYFVWMGDSEFEETDTTPEYIELRSRAFGFLVRLDREVMRPFMGRVFLRDGDLCFRYPAD